MGEFFKDYGKLCKDTGAFYKKHWKGVIVLNAVLVGAELAYFNKNKIKDIVKNKLPKKDINEMES